MIARILIVVIGLGLAAAALLMSMWPLDLRAAAASVGLFSAALALGPAEARAYVRQHWSTVLRLVVSIVIVAVAIMYARRQPSKAIAVGGTLGVVALELAFVLLDPTIRGWIKWLSVEQWRAIDRETDRTPEQAGSFAWLVLVVLVVVAVSLTLQEYLGDRGAFEDWFPTKTRDAYAELKGFAWWSGWRVLGYVVMPIIAILCMPRVKLREFHVSLRGFASHLWIYLLMFSLILPAVIEASMTASFRHTYPFYRLANRSAFDLWTWEAFYAAQFISLEFFFRGFILNGLRRAMGSTAVFVMIVPYCMIHYGKPLPETLGAIGAGIILGTLAMRTRSIWGGVLIHIGVAITMDMLALRGLPVHH
jgi:membrane protease YdiL (CAAX protease family)